MKKKLIAFTILLAIACSNNIFAVNKSLVYTNHVHNLTCSNTMIDPDPIKST